MRNTIKRIFRRKNDKKGSGVGKTPNESTPDEASKPSVSRLSPLPPAPQPKASSNGSSSNNTNNNVLGSIASSLPATPKFAETSAESKDLRSTASSIVAPPICEEQQLDPPPSSLPVASTPEATQAPLANHPPAENHTMTVNTVASTDNAEAEDPVAAAAAAAMASTYDAIPVLEQTKLPRGGVSVETKAVGRVQVSFKC